MSKIGFSTGCLYKTDIKFEDIIKLYHSLGANVIELSFAKPSRLLDFTLTRETIRDVKKYDFVSLHAPWREIKYSSDANTDNVIRKLRYLSKKLDVRGIVMHPDIIDDFELLEKSGLPFLLENMDKKKEYGINAGDFEKLRKEHKFGFVFDVEHAYEHDSSMELAKELLFVMHYRLSHMHISGSIGVHRHLPVYIADNKDAITKILNFGIKVPKILEGVFTTYTPKMISEELNFVKKVSEPAYLS